LLFLGGGGAGAAGPPRGGRYTTYYLGPLDEQGYVDYVAALDADFGDVDAKPQDNAFVGILECVDTSQWNERHLAAVCTRLGIAIPDVNDGRVRFIWINEFARQNGLDSDQAKSQLSLAQESVVWDETQWPVVVQWLEYIEPALDDVARAIEREKYFAPVVMLPEDASLHEALLPQLSVHRQIARAFCVQARRDLNRGEIDRPLRVFLKLRRLAWLQRHESFEISHFVGVSIDALAHYLSAELLNHPGLAMTHVDQLNVGLTHLPPGIPIYRVCSISLRVHLLHDFQAVRRGHSALLGGWKAWSYVNELENERVDSMCRLVEGVVADSRFDVERVLRRINAVFDSLPGADGLLPYLELSQRLEGWEQAIDARRDSVNAPICQHP